MKIALFGGSFDPPHIGHKMIVDSALKELDIDKLFIVPAYINPFKNTFSASPEQRYEWLKEIFKEYPKVEVLDYEIAMKRKVPTIETVEFLYKNFDIEKLYLIIGDDNLNSLHKWHQYKKLKKLTTLVVATRYKKEFPKNLKILQISANISSTKLRQDMDTSFLPASIAKEISKNYKDKDGKDT